jgi:hypothetical protein
VQRRRIGEDVALGEGAGLGVGVAQAGDPVVEQAAAGVEQPGQGLGVDVDVGRADVLDHADAGDRVERLGVELAIVGHADLDPVLEAALGHPPLGLGGLRLGQGDADRPHPVVLRRVDDQ